MKITGTITTLELKSEPEWRLAAQVLLTLRPSLDVEKYVARREQLIADGYRLIGGFLNEGLISMASFTISPHAMLGRELLVHDMATRVGSEGRGFGSAIIRELENVARREQCGRIFVHTRKAQRFYGKCGFAEYSTGMIKTL